jgi:hypothetical protein
VKHKGIKIENGFVVNGDGKKVVERIKGFGLNKSAQIAQRKSKKQRVVRRGV